LNDFRKNDENDEILSLSGIFVTEDEFFIAFNNFFGKMIIRDDFDNISGKMMKMMNFVIFH
jgi:hypothetical protein